LVAGTRDTKFYLFVSIVLTTTTPVLWKLHTNFSNHHLKRKNLKKTLHPLNTNILA
jgi:hypothetical protein